MRTRYSRHGDFARIEAPGSAIAAISPPCPSPQRTRRGNHGRRSALGGAAEAPVVVSTLAIAAEASRRAVRRPAPWFDTPPRVSDNPGKWGDPWSRTTSPKPSGSRESNPPLAPPAVYELSAASGGVEGCAGTFRWVLRRSSNSSSHFAQSGSPPTISFVSAPHFTHRPIAR
jgi:hypothetical protein